MQIICKSYQVTQITYASHTKSHRSHSYLNNQHKQLLLFTIQLCWHVDKSSVGVKNERQNHWNSNKNRFCHYNSIIYVYHSHVYHLFHRITCEWIQEKIYSMGVIQLSNDKFKIGFLFVLLYLFTKTFALDCIFLSVLYSLSSMFSYC